MHRRRLGAGGWSQTTPRCMMMAGHGRAARRRRDDMIARAPAPDLTRSVHPLDPLSAEEIARAWHILREEKGLGAPTRVVTIALLEPPKETVASHRPGDPVDRAA